MKNINSVSFLAFLIVLYVSRNAMPYTVYPLILLLLPFTLYQFVNIKSAQQAFIKGIKMFAPIILLIVIELMGIFFTVSPSHRYSLDILKNIIFISTFLFLLAYHIRSKDDFMQLIEKVSQYFILFSIIVSLLGLWKFFYSPQFISYKYINGIQYFRWGASLVSDYNFFALFLLNGLIFGLYHILHSPDKIKYKTLFLLGLQLTIFTGLLSGSRRFIFCLGIFFIICLLLLIPFLFKKIFSNKFSYKYLLLFLTLSIFNFGIIYSFLSYFSLITEKVEKTLCIDGENVNKNIVSVSTRINSAVSCRLIKVHTVNEKLVDNSDEKLVDNNINNSIDVVPLTSTRKTLWILGKKIYHEYTIPQKIFGRGFSFFNIFQKETKHFIYPHYIFLSVLLFSGIIGLVLYMVILFWSSIIYLFHLKNLGILFLLFIINFIFGFFSFTDFFGSTFYAILLIFPFLYQRLHKHEKILQ
jgi:hypothetical protein